MIKRLIPFIILIVLLLPGCIGEQSSEKTGSVSIAPKINTTDLPVLISELKKSVVHITYSVDHEEDYWGYSDSEFIGSGVIYSLDGKNIYVLTNRHVVDLNFPEYYSEVDNEEIIVRTFDNDKFVVKERLVAPDRLDLAIVKFESNEQKIESASISNRVPVTGEEVLIIGMPEELDWSVSKGIVSASRNFDSEGELGQGKYTAIQTDAAINSGNSGGGMFLTDGRLIGINTFKYIGFFTEGLNFAISSVDFLNLKDDFIKLDLITPSSKPLAGAAAAIAVADADYGYDEDNFIVSFSLMDEHSLITTTKGTVQISAVDEKDTVLYNKSFSVDENDFISIDDYIFNGKKAVTFNIPFSDFTKSKYGSADFIIEFNDGENTFKKTVWWVYLPDELTTLYDDYNYSNDYYDNYNYDDYYYDDYYYDDYGYYELDPIGTSATKDGIKVTINEGGFSTDYYSSFMLNIEFENTGSKKKEITIRDAVIVLDSEQIDADFWYESDKVIGAIYPNAHVKKQIEFLDTASSASSATLYLELRSIENSALKTTNFAINFKPG